MMLILDIEYAGKFIGDTDRILFNSKNEILYSPPEDQRGSCLIKMVKRLKKQEP